MLKSLSPLLSADLLWAMKTMGHGEDLLVCDSNHPAPGIARHTTSGKIIEVSGADVTATIRAILTLFPLDTFVEAPITRMQVVGNPSEELPVFAEVKQLADAAEGRPVKMAALERFAFYEAGRQCFAVVRTSEFRPYACFILRKGVIFP